MRIKLNLKKLDVAALRRIFGHFGEHLKMHRTRLILSGLSLLGVAAMTVLRPWPLKIVFDYILIPLNDSTGQSFLQPLAEWDGTAVLILATVMVLLLAVINGLLTYSHSVLSKTVGHRIVADIRMRLFSHVQSLPQSYHDYRETGELMTRMTGDISLLQNLLVSIFIELSSQIILIVGMLGVMFWLDWQLTLLIIGLLPFFLIAAFRFSWRIKDAARHQREMYGRIIASIQESFSGIAQIKGYTQEKRREKLIGKSMSRDVKANVKTTKLAANYARVVEMIAAVGTCMVMWVGVQKVMSGKISPGDLLIFISYLRGIYRPLKSISRITTKIAKAVVRGEKIVDVLEMKPEVADLDDAISAKGVNGDIRFDKVDFSYLPDRPVLKQFSCLIPEGKTTLLIGSTGAGKSTVAKLILRLYDIDSGEISFSENNLNNYRIRSLRKRITPLSQETFLFRASIAENIGFGRRHATREEIEAAARMVGADSFINKMQDGYDTLVGEGGLTLSGGQRQRISFARAALRRTPVMLFDEPATGLDIHAEREAKEVLASMSRSSSDSSEQSKRTILIITHRLHFLDLADWVILVGEGQMVEQGHPGQLLEKKGEFYRFVNGSGIGLDDKSLRSVESKLEDRQI